MFIKKMGIPARSPNSSLQLIALRLSAENPVLQDRLWRDRQDQGHVRGASEEAEESGGRRGGGGGGHEEVKTQGGQGADETQSRGARAGQVRPTRHGNRYARVINSHPFLRPVPLLNWGGENWHTGGSGSPSPVSHVASINNNYFFLSNTVHSPLNTLPWPPLLPPPFPHHPLGTSNPTFHSVFTYRWRKGSAETFISVPVCFMFTFSVSPCSGIHSS